ncbi:ABC transporter [Streptomyces cinnamoneus]|uniref:ABC transporter n=1 Tax=Streptomyces cinnamoneus TaxID=53446 RepID=A0A2G1XML0_STRCJ|nr:ABC transporter ATP-binding protein [Streptomyces cinnamoneus]PHQ52443.1 ABC transporter [Streptomyces cinnamoneus]PPT15975.1 ABC transporter ATP-binding protein [Streptomyces cinnamoneus]
MSDGSAVRVRDLRKAYGHRTVLDGVDLDVGRGEVVAVLGPNGAGKTTLTEILEGYRGRDGGEVTVLGEDPGTAGPDWRDRIGIVLQGNGDLAHLTPREAFRHFAGYYSTPRDPDELLAVVGLVEQAGKRIGKLSGGQRRRVDVGLSMLGDPELIFLDEPTTGFDPEARRRFWDTVRSLRASGTSVLLTTHYLDEAEALADQVAVLAHGRVVAAAPPAELGGAGRRRPVVHWRENGTPRQETTDDPSAVVQRLTRELGGSVPDLRVESPSLEDVYLDMISDDRSEPSA